MTRGSIPQFDLYAELEVSRQATPAVIEAAHRALVKRHHPDVSASDDSDRVTRLNIARDWLLDPARRARYDGGPAYERSKPTPAAAPAAARRERTAPRERPARRTETARPSGSSRSSSAASFGVHSREVRQLLAELRELDGARTRRIVEAQAGVDATTYVAARDAALAASHPDRGAEWAFARDAATVIVKGKVADPSHASVVSFLAADIAGAIVVKDRISAAQFDALRLPWARSAPAAAAGATAAATAVASPAATLAPRETRVGGAGLRAPRVTVPQLSVPSIALPAVTLPSIGRPKAKVPSIATPALHAPNLALPRPAVALPPIGLRSSLERAGRAFDDRSLLTLGVGVIALAVVVGFVLVGGGPSRPESNVAGLTSEPSSGVLFPGASTSVPLFTDAVAVPSAGPSATPKPPKGGAGHTTPPPTATRRPTPPPTARPSAAPTARPSAPPTPSPTPQPTPAPTPRLTCTVTNLIGKTTGGAQLAWNTDGFTGTVFFSPAPPPQYKIGWQSLTAGTEVPCTSDITVQATAP